MKYIYAFLIISIVILGGCQNNNQNVLTNETAQPINTPNVENNKSNEKNNTVEKKDKNYESMFFPPNFVVNKFNINYENKNLSFSMKYTFTADLYKILKEANAEFSFFITYPQELLPIFQKERSDLIKAAAIKEDGQLNYTVHYNETFEDELTT